MTDEEIIQHFDDEEANDNYERYVKGTGSSKIDPLSISFKHFLLEPFILPAQLQNQDINGNKNFLDFE